LQTADGAWRLFFANAGGAEIDEFGVSTRRPIDVLREGRPGSLRFYSAHLPTYVLTKKLKWTGINGEWEQS